MFVILSFLQCFCTSILLSVRFNSILKQMFKIVFSSIFEEMLSHIKFYYSLMINHEMRERCGCFLKNSSGLKHALVNDLFPVYLHIEVVSQKHDQGLITVSSVAGHTSSCLYSPCLPIQFLRTFSATLFSLISDGIGLLLLEQLRLVLLQ